MVFMQMDIMIALDRYGDANDASKYPETFNNSKHWKESPKLCEQLDYYRGNSDKHLTVNTSHECSMHVLMEAYSAYIRDLHCKQPGKLKDYTFKNGWEGKKGTRIKSLTSWTDQGRDKVSAYLVPPYGNLKKQNSTTPYKMPITFTACLDHLFGRSDSTMEAIHDDWSFETIPRPTKGQNHQDELMPEVLPTPTQTEMPATLDESFQRLTKEYAENNSLDPCPSWATDIINDLYDKLKSGQTLRTEQPNDNDAAPTAAAAPST